MYLLSVIVSCSVIVGIEVELMVLHWVQESSFGVFVGGEASRMFIYMQRSSPALCWEQRTMDWAVLLGVCVSECLV